MTRSRFTTFLPTYDDYADDLLSLARSSLSNTSHSSFLSFFARIKFQLWCAINNSVSTEKGPSLTVRSWIWIIYFSTSYPLIARVVCWNSRMSYSWEESERQKKGLVDDGPLCVCLRLEMAWNCKKRYDVSRGKSEDDVNFARKANRKKRKRRKRSFGNRQRGSLKKHKKGR